MRFDSIIYKFTVLARDLHKAFAAHRLNICLLCNYIYAQYSKLIMATSAFKSSTRRTSIGSCGGSAVSRGANESSSTASTASSSTSTTTRSHRRARSLSRFSPRVPEPQAEYTTAPKGKFVTTKRGSEFSEISLDDLALDIFSSPQEKNQQREERSGRRSGEVGRWASDTASSKRRGRSVSRRRDNGGGSVEGSEGRSKILDHSRRRRSLSVVRYQVTDSESDADNSQSFRHLGKEKNLNDKSNITTSMSKATPNGRQPGRSLSQKHISVLHDGYSSHSPASTDDDKRGGRMSKFGTEKTIRAVYAQKKSEHPTDEGSTELNEAIRKELRHAVEEIRTEFQAMGRGKTNLQEDKTDYDHVLSMIEQKYSTKLKQRSNDTNRMSNQLGEEAEKYFEDFVSSVEDTDISSFDGERSDASSAKGGTINQKYGTARVEAQSYQSPAGSNSHPTGVDGVILPWLQWETSNDASLSGKIIRHPPETPKSLERNDNTDTMTMMHEPSSNNSKSSIGSSSPGIFDVCLEATKEENSTSDFKECGGCKKPQFDMEEYRQLQTKEELLFERYKERQRIDCGGLWLCASNL